jgi:L-fuconate dehydratase
MGGHQTFVTGFALSGSRYAVEMISCTAVSRGMKIRNIAVRDIRFPTSLQQDGSDALNQGDYSATYVVLETDSGLEGHGLTFTNGRGNEIVVAAVHALERHVVNRNFDDVVSDMRAFYRDLTVDKQLRWLGPEKGILHMATGAILNAVWDLWAKREKKPMWKHLVDLSPEQLVSTIDFTYITDALTPEEAVTMLRSAQVGREAREAEMRAEGYPAYTTSTGWLGYPDEKVRRLCQEAIANGWTAFKMKVGQNLDDNIHRASVMREEIGWQRKLMMDANQCWGVDESIAQMKALARFDPWWIEEPTSPDDVLGHARIAREIAPIAVATGEVCHNRVIFKQLLQADAIRYVQVDSCRMGGVNEAVAVILLSKKFGKPVCPHAGGVGLCEYVQHLSIFDYIAVSGSLKDRVCEYVDHLHEHFVDPCIVRNARYAAPLRPGYSIDIKTESIAEYEFPAGRFWKGGPR